MFAMQITKGAVKGEGEEGGQTQSRQAEISLKRPSQDLEPGPELTSVQENGAQSSEPCQAYTYMHNVYIYSYTYIYAHTHTQSHDFPPTVLVEGIGT